MQNLRLVEKFQEFKARLNLIREKYKEDPFIVAYSGGKDSSVLLHLTFEYCREKGIPLIVLHSDTLVENPLIEMRCKEFLNTLKVYASDCGFSLKIIVTTPDLQSTFWVNLIGKGYPLPNFRFRWCQKWLKIKPVEKALREINGPVFVAMRLNESTERKKSMKKRIDGIELKNGTKKRFFAPLYDWDDTDIWEFIVENTENSSFWGKHYNKLFTLYKKARGECPLIPDKSFRSNGCGSRFGCWVCTVVREDKTMKNLSTDDEILRELFSFRNWLVNFCNNPENRTGYTRKGKYVGFGKGTIALQAREKILEELLNLQDKIQLVLVRESELSFIFREWELSLKTVLEKC